MTNLPFWLLLLLLATTLPSAAFGQQGQAPPASEATLDAIVARAAALPRLHSLLVSRDGAIEVERYFNGARATRLANIKSASKSVISALVGIAISRGLIKDVTEPIAPFFAGEMERDADPRKRAITVEQLLTMQSGLESTSSRNYGAWVRSANWVRFALGRPLVSDPGTAMEYSTGSSHILSALLTRATRRSTWQFAQQHLARPLGFSLARWPQDPQGVYFGGNEMLMTPRQMLAFGELYLNRGRAGHTEVLPASWIEQSWIPRTTSRFGPDREYGYSWWIRDLAGQRAYYAWGYGGQFIFVVPSARMVIVTTSASNVSQERREHLQAIYDIAAEIVSG